MYDGGFRVVPSQYSRRSLREVAEAICGEYNNRKDLEKRLENSGINPGFVSTIGNKTFGYHLAFKAANLDAYKILAKIEPEGVN